MAKNISRRLVGLSSSAIAAIYLAGYLATRGVDAGSAGSATGATSIVSASSAPSGGVTVVVPTQMLAGGASSGTATPSSGYADAPTRGRAPAASAASTSR